MEVPDVWLSDINPWDMKRREVRYPVKFGDQEVRLYSKTKERDISGRCDCLRYANSWISNQERSEFTSLGLRTIVRIRSRNFQRRQLL